MIDFQPVRLEDKALIERYTLHAGLDNCNFAFANLYCWHFAHHSAWALVEGFLVIRFLTHGERLGYMQPVGEGDWTRILPLLAEDAAANGQRFRMVGLDEAGKEQVRKTAPYAVESNRDLENYIYNADDLRNLAGRRYQPKRNHINRFTAQYPDYRYEQMTRAHIAQCIELELAWRRRQGWRDGDVWTEQHAMEAAFAHFEELELLGGCLFVGEQLVAFTYGSAINDHLFDTHVEKADTEFDGAFTMINKLFAEHIPAKFTQINREEDLGIDGLRQAKLSYHPALLQPAYIALPLQEDEIACKELWMKVFDDEPEIDSFLLHYYRRENMLTVEADGKLTAMLHLIPVETAQGRALYIYGVSTAPAYRHRGFAAQLMREAMRRIEEEKVELAFLITEEAWLRDFYARYGFEGQVPTVFESDDDFPFGTDEAVTDLAMVWRADKAKPLPEQIHAKI